LVTLARFLQVRTTLLVDRESLAEEYEADDAVIVPVVPIFLTRGFAAYTDG